MKIVGTGIAILAFGLGGCGARTGNEAAAGGNAAGVANAALPATNQLAAGIEAAPDPACPFPSRGWRAAVVREGTPPELRIALTGEIRNDSSGRSPFQESQDTPPPTIFLDINSESSVPLPAPANSTDPLMQPVRDTDWHEGTTYYAYEPGHNSAVIRCNGREVARVPIPAPR